MSSARRRRRTALWLILAPALAALVVAAWSGLQAFRGAQSLEAAGDTLESLSADLTAGTDLIPPLRAASADTLDARKRFEDPLLRLVQQLPLVSRPLRTAAIISITADTAIRQAALPLAEAAGNRPAERVLGDGGSIDVPYLISLAAPASVAGAALSSAEEALKQAPKSSGFNRLDVAREKLTVRLDELSETVRALQVTANVGPELLGRDRPKTYFLGVQNPAEARGTGGLIGGFVILEADNGIIRVVDSGSNTALQAFAQGFDAPSYGPEYEDHWGPFAPTAAFVNSNVSPHFPYAAQTWARLWREQSGRAVDGVLALDPVALSYLMQATGPIQLSDGTRASSGNLVDLTLRDVYAKFSTANRERKEYLQEVTKGVAQSISQGRLDSVTLLRALSRSAQERRALIWTPDTRVQEVLGESPVAGRLPAQRRAVGDVINNAAGGKLDYYLGRALRYHPSCSGSRSRLALKLTNNAPRSGLPDYVSPELLRQGNPANTNISVVNLYLPPGSDVVELSLNGREQPRRQGEELGLRWVSTVVSTRPGQTTEIVVIFDEPPGPLTVPVRIAQPLVLTESYEALPCGPPA